MKNQEQPKDSYWYNNRFVLILMFIAVYVVIPAFLLFLENRQLSDSESKQCITCSWTVALYLILSIVLPSVVLFYMARDKRKMEKQKTFEMVFRNQHYANELGTEIKNAIREAINKTDINESIDKAFKSKSFKKRVIDYVADTLKNSSPDLYKRLNGIIENALKSSQEVNDTINSTIHGIISDQNNPLKETINDAFSKLSSDNDISKVLKRFVAESVDNQIYDVIKEKLKESFGEKFDEDENQKVIKEIAQKMVKSLKKEEIDAQRYRFAERIVEEICKNTKSEASDICAIKDLVTSILTDEQKGGCILDVPKGKNKISIAITDRNCKHLTFVIDYKKPEIIPSVDSGVFELCNGFTIEIEGGKIKSIN